MASRGSRTIPNAKYVLKGEPEYMHPGHIKSKLSNHAITDKIVKDTMERDPEEAYLYFSDFQTDQGSILGGVKDAKLNLKSQLHQTQFKNSGSVNDAVVFAETASTLYAGENGQYASVKRPEAFLIDPVARPGTSRSGFGLDPCGGGSKGKARYMADPGEQIEVSWIIKNPVNNSK